MVRLCMLFAALICCVSVSGQSGAELSMETLNHDFGKMKFGGDSSVFTFEFTNTGDEPLVISRVKTTCTCIKVEYDRQPVAPENSGKIKVSYNPKKDKGAFNKGIQIFSNSSSGRLIVFVKGEVVD